MRETLVRQQMLVLSTTTLLIMNLFSGLVIAENGKRLHIIGK